MPTQHLTTIDTAHTVWLLAIRGLQGGQIGGTSEPYTDHTKLATGSSATARGKSVIAITQRQAAESPWGAEGMMVVLIGME